MTKVTVLQWNALADHFATQDEKGFPYAKKEDLEWDNRKHKYLPVIKSHSPCLIFMQEVDHYDDFFQPMLNELGYESLWWKKNHERHHDGCLVAWKRCVFTKPEDERPVMQSFPSVEFTSCALEQTQGFISVGLVHETTQLKFNVICTHLKAKSDGESQRNVQTHQLLTFESGIEKDISIVGGDFNCEPSSTAIKLMEDSFFEDFSPKGVFTTFKKRDTLIKRKIDYIFCKGVNVEFLCSKSMMESIEQQEHLPRGEHPSDHRPVWGVLEILSHK